MTLKIADVFAMAQELCRGVIGIWDSADKWEIDQVPCEGGGMPTEPPHIPPDQVLQREYQLSFAITGVWSW